MVYYVVDLCNAFVRVALVMLMKTMMKTGTEDAQDPIEESG